MCAIDVELWIGIDMQVIGSNPVYLIIAYVFSVVWESISSYSFVKFTQNFIIH
jgi:hypothetical protein